MTSNDHYSVPDMWWLTSTCVFLISWLKAGRVQGFTISFIFTLCCDQQFRHKYYKIAEWRVWPLWPIVKQSNVSAAMVTFRLQYWPGRSREKWKRQSRSRQNRCHTLSRRSLIAHHMYGDSSTITWSHAKPLQLHSWSIIEREVRRGKRETDMVRMKTLTTLCVTPVQLQQS